MAGAAHARASFGLGPAETDTVLRAMLNGATRTFFDSGLPADRVIDLVPVRPLAEAEAEVRKAYRERLAALHAKLTAA